jgi:signal peptidase I
VKNILKYVSLGLVFILLAVALSVNIASRTGWRVDAVLSGSMEPQLKVGGVVVTQPLSLDPVLPGDIITFYSPLIKQMITHRVVSVESGELVYFRTKGDANDHPDPFIVPVPNVAGKVCFHVPYLGFAMQTVKTPLGILLTLVIPGTIVIIIEATSIWRTLSGKKKSRLASVDK